MPTPGAPPDAAVARFREDLERLTDGAPGRLGLAVSGGPDSMALLLLAQHAFPGQVWAATVDHGLRAAAAGEAGFVADYCRRHGVPHAVLKVALDGQGNLMAEARAARYQALAAWQAREALDWLVTGHQANDQVETLIMRLNRSSGIAGLSSVRARHGQVIRPLLGWLRTELLDVLRQSGTEWIEDPTNREDRFDRARLRKALAETSWLDVRKAAASACALSDADQAIEWTVELFEKSFVSESDRVVYFEAQGPGFPAEILRRLVLRCLNRVDPALSPRGRELDGAIASLQTGRPATLGQVRCHVGSSGDWTFEAAPARRAGT